MSRYPNDWSKIAASIKAQAGYRCSKCGRQFEKGDRNLQVHHQDYTPENCHPSNLIVLCGADHLEKHRGAKGNVTPGQLSLRLW